MTLVVRLVVGLYVVVGVAFYASVETKPCETAEHLRAHRRAWELARRARLPWRRDEYDASTCTEPWTAVDALYFLTASMSTVGYGDLAP